MGRKGGHKSACRKVESETAKGLFDLLDYEGDGQIEVEEFVTAIHRLHGQAWITPQAVLALYGAPTCSLGRVKIVPGMPVCSSSVGT